MSHLLVVDDEPGIRHIVKLALSRLNMTVTEASSAESALQQIEASVPDIVLMDLRLPDLPGVELALQMRQKGIQSPLVLMSASTELAWAARKAQATAYLGKPFKLSQLQHLIKEILHPSFLSTGAKTTT